MVWQNGTSSPGPVNMPTSRPSSPGGSSSIAVTWRCSSSSTSTSRSAGVSTTSMASMAASPNSAITMGWSGCGWKMCHTCDCMRSDDWRPRGSRKRDLNDDMGPPEARDLWFGGSR